MPAVLSYDIRVDEGADWDDTTFVWDDGDAVTDLTGATAEMVVCASSFGTDPLVTLTDTNGITLGGTAGTIKPVFSAELIATIIEGLTVEQGPFLSGYTQLRVTLSTGSRKVYLDGKFIVQRRPG